MEPHITYHGMEHSAALDARIVELTNKLEEFHPKVTRCTVFVDQHDRHKQKGNLFEVTVDVHVPGREIVASKQQHEDAFAATTDAFEVVYRQLSEDIRKARGEVKRHTDVPRDIPSQPT